jgi:hypothetical protein
MERACVESQYRRQFVAVAGCDVAATVTAADGTVTAAKTKLAATADRLTRRSQLASQPGDVVKTRVVDVDDIDGRGVEQVGEDVVDVLNVDAGAPNVERNLTTRCRP